jgi:hypothetical protein
MSGPVNSSTTRSNPSWRALRTSVSRARAPAAVGKPPARFGSVSAGPTGGIGIGIGVVASVGALVPVGAALLVPVAQATVSSTATRPAPASAGRYPRADGRPRVRSGVVGDIDTHSI